MMENYMVRYTLSAWEGLDEIYSYVAFHLRLPDSAERIVKSIKDSISSLSFMPERFSSCEKLA